MNSTEKHSTRLPEYSGPRLNRFPAGKQDSDSTQGSPLSDFSNFRRLNTGRGTLVDHENLACTRKTGRDRFLDTLGGLWNVHLEYRVRYTLSFSRKTLFFEIFMFFHGFPSKNKGFAVLRSKTVAANPLISKGKP